MTSYSRMNDVRYCGLGLDATYCVERSRVEYLVIV